MKEQGKRLKEIRLYLDKNQSDMAKYCDLNSQATYSNYEIGTREIPLALLKKLEENGFSSSWILTGTGTMQIKDSFENAFSHIKADKTNDFTRFLDIPEWNRDKENLPDFITRICDENRQLKEKTASYKIENETIKAENKALQTQMIRLEAQNELLREQNERLLSSVESGAKKYSTSGSNSESADKQSIRKSL